MRGVSKQKIEVPLAIIPQNGYFRTMKKTNWKLETSMHFDAAPKLFEFARKNRENPTEAEGVLWEEIRNNRLANHKFRRQHPVGNYIADFYCHAKRLVIEIDGAYHLTPEQKQYDEFRTSALNQLGIREIRFSNDAVLKNCSGVLGAIMNALEEEGDALG